MDNRITVYYTKESGRPPLDTTKTGLDLQEKLYGPIIVEVLPFVDGQRAAQKKKTNTPMFCNTISLKKDVSEADVIKFLAKRGKTTKSISTYLSVPMELIEKLLEEKTAVETK